MKRSFREILIRVIILFVGLCIAHLGVTQFLLADLGADPFNVLPGGAFGAGTIICAFLVGPVAGFFLPVNERIITRIVSRHTN